MSAKQPLDTPVSESEQQRWSMLAPVAYSESSMPSLRLARSSRVARKVAKYLFIVLVFTILLMAFAPWQQSVTGTGNVLAYSPDQRQQIIQAAIKGRIALWGDNIYENALVKKGQVIAEIRDLDDEYSSRLNQQLTNTKQAFESAKQQLTADNRAFVDSQIIVELNDSRAKTYERVLKEITAAQDAYVEMARKKVQAKQEELNGYQAALPQLEAEYKRIKKLEEAGNISLQKYQEVTRKFNEAKAKAKAGESYLGSAKDELAGKIRDRSAYIEKAQVDIDKAKSELEKARVDVSKNKSKIAKTEQDMNKAEKDMLDMQVKVSRQANQIIKAPFDGFIVQITPNLGTAILKEGDPICTIVPYTKDRSVQIWLDGNDAPLVEPGRHVRLQFEGWPAVQFAGWPSVAVGTFGGDVVSVDATDNGNGKFRILIRPDPNEPAWPTDRFLRQGVRANAWVLLNRVPLWYEVWRNLNGFPPVVSMDEPGQKSTKSKPPKLPK